MHASHKPLFRSRGFSMTELLVVISIIVILAGVLLVAMKGVRRRALYTQTESAMDTFVGSCNAFYMEQQRYPGILPESKLEVAANPRISGTENAILEMNGGAVRGDDPVYNSPLLDSWVVIDIDGSPTGKIKVNLDAIGEGPRINGTPYDPYFPGRVEAAQGQENEPSFAGDRHIPDLLDAWGQPIIYVRQARPSGPLAGPASSTPQFLMGGMVPYLASESLGEMHKDQTHNSNGSILNHASVPNAAFAQLIRHPAFGEPLQPLQGTARGAIVLFSAGPDGIYFSRQDGPGTNQNPVDDIDAQNPTVVDEYDDIRRFGGG